VPSIATILVFSLVAAGFAALPGPSNIFVLTRGIGAGRRPALAAAAGCATGAMGYVLLTAAGLSALLASSVLALRALHLLGAAYLFLLAARAFRSGGATLSAEAGPQRSPWLSYRAAVLVELTNPKVALFFLALFPQFIDRARGAPWSQTLILGVLFVGVGLISDSACALASASIASRLHRDSALARRQGRLTGVLYLGLGAWATVSGASPRAR